MSPGYGPGSLRSVFRTLKNIEHDEVQVFVDPASQGSRAVLLGRSHPRSPAFATVTYPSPTLWPLPTFLRTGTINGIGLFWREGEERPFTQRGTLAFRFGFSVP
jgi:hypothetical protein